VAREVPAERAHRVRLAHPARTRAAPPDKAVNRPAVQLELLQPRAQEVRPEPPGPEGRRVPLEQAAQVERVEREARAQPEQAGRVALSATTAASTLTTAVVMMAHPRRHRAPAHSGRIVRIVVEVGPLEARARRVLRRAATLVCTRTMAFVMTRDCVIRARIAPIVVGRQGRLHSGAIHVFITTTVCAKTAPKTLRNHRVLPAPIVPIATTRRAMALLGGHAHRPITTTPTAIAVVASGTQPATNPAHSCLVAAPTQATVFVFNRASANSRDAAQKGAAVPRDQLRITD
jgi:hypothetical protein